MVQSKAIDLHTDAFDCAICRERGYFKDRNCSGSDIPEQFFLSDSVRFTVKDNVINFCPKILEYDEDVVEILQAFAYYQKGIPYCSGSFLEQPFYIVEAMMILDNIAKTYILDG